MNGFQRVLLYIFIISLTHKDCRTLCSVQSMCFSILSRGHWCDNKTFCSSWLYAFSHKTWRNGTTWWTVAFAKTQRYVSEYVDWARFYLLLCNSSKRERRFDKNVLYDILFTSFRSKCMVIRHFTNTAVIIFWFSWITFAHLSYRKPLNQWGFLLTAWILQLWGSRSRTEPSQSLTLGIAKLRPYHIQLIPLQNRRVGSYLTWSSVV